MRVVAVITSGRPLIIDDLMPYADAIVAAWLPGTEGDGVADVLFGTHKPTGKLSFVWPKGTTTDYHIGSAGYPEIVRYRLRPDLLTAGGGLQAAWVFRPASTLASTWPCPGPTQCSAE